MDITREQLTELAQKLSETYSEKLDFMRGLSFSTTAIQCVLHPELKVIFEDMVKMVENYVNAINLSD